MNYNGGGGDGYGKKKSKGAGVHDGGTGCEKGGVTVYTLQYYDKEGLLSPTAVSEGGRRLYTDKDVVRLHQISGLWLLSLQCVRRYVFWH